MKSSRKNTVLSEMMQKNPLQTGAMKLHEGDSSLAPVMENSESQVVDDSKLGSKRGTLKDQMFKAATGGAERVDSGETPVNFN